MKTPLLFVLLLSAGIGYGQRATEPFRGCNEIEVATALTDSAAYKSAGRYLIAQGFTIDRTERDFYTLSTKEKPLGNPAAQIGWRLNITVKPGGVVVFRGEQNYNTRSGAVLGVAPARAWVPIAAKTANPKKSLDDVFFEEMRQTALAFYASFDGKEVYYSKR